MSVRTRSSFVLMVGIVTVTVVASTSRAGFTSGSDGSDGALDCAWLAKDASFDCAANCFADQPCEFVVDLSAALSDPGTMWKTPGGDIDGDGFGDGVYDGGQWAVVYKFTTIDIPANVHVKFKNHRSGAPVVWLAQGEVDIFGHVDLDGEDAHAVQTWPSFSEPGPGGFAGGAPADRYSRMGSIGYGPGSAKVVGTSGGDLTDGCYSGRQQYNLASCTNEGHVYGNPEVFPLIGGSGGGVSFNSSVGPEGSLVAGAGGGGAILIASDTAIQLAEGSRITAFGGTGYCDNDMAQFSGDGTAGSIRIAAGMRVFGTPYLGATGLGWPPPDQCRDGGAFGRVRVEAPILDVPFLGPPEAGISAATTPGAVFPPLEAPRLQVLSLGDGEKESVAAPPDPDAGPDSPDVEIDTDQLSEVHIRAWNIPVGTAVTVRVVPILGNEITVTSTPLAQEADGSLSATAEVTFPPGRSEIQLRANWAP